MTRTTAITAALLTLAVGIVPAAALAVTAAIGAGAPGWIEVPFRLVCHGIDARSLELWGATMPICARCFAIYLGALAGIATFVSIPLFRRNPVPTILLALAVLPLALDGVSQALGLRESTNLLRLATGLPSGFVFLLWILGRVESAVSPASA